MQEPKPSNGDAQSTPGTDPIDIVSDVDNGEPGNPSAEPATDLEAQLKASLAESAQTKDALLRVMADAENMRKRSVSELANAHRYAVEGFASNLLAVKDTLEMALADKTSTTDQLRMGVDLTLKNLAAAFDKAKITEVNPLSQKFDPSLHQAVSHIESDQPANTIAQVFQKGYVLQDRVLRPAMVAVAKPKPGQPVSREKPVETRGN